jgi:hypothetical protein
MPANRLIQALSRALLSFALAFGGFFGIFGLAVTGMLLVAFFVDEDAAGASFAGYVMAKGHPWIYVCGGIHRVGHRRAVVRRDAC